MAAERNSDFFFAALLSCCAACRYLCTFSRGSRQTKHSGGRTTHRSDPFADSDPQRLQMAISAAELYE